MHWIYWIWSKIAALILAWLISLPALPQQVDVTQTLTQTTVAENTVTPTITTTITPTITNYGNIDEWLAQSNWPQWTWETVKRIVWCESRNIVGIATNPPHVGLMQVNVNYWGRVNPDAVSELNQGFEVFKIQGWGAWSCY